MINRNKKIETQYQFNEQSSHFIYSNSDYNVELELITGAYSTELNEDLLMGKAEFLDEEEIFGCGCGEIYDDHCE